MPTGQGHYDANYGNFKTELYAQVRRDAYGEDIGQNSWHTVEEQNKFLSWLELGPDKRLLDVACGAGGPALRIAAATGCSIVGVDIHEHAIAAACSLAAERGLSPNAEFRVVNASGQLLFPDADFDAITCIDAINHLTDRPRFVAEWVRLLKPNGRLLFTDPITLTGPLTNLEMTVRSSAGMYVVVPPGYDEKVLEQAGLQVLVAEDVTENMAVVADRRRAARASRAAELAKIEGEKAYQGQQEFLTMAACLAKERRLSRFVYVAKKK
jgi:2-polyprenyl-3-methyl-5-hydroxy-6-metoxy-1,4-benzoquinol methylase